MMQDRVHRAAPVYDPARRRGEAMVRCRHCGVRLKRSRRGDHLWECAVLIAKRDAEAGIPRGAGRPPAKQDARAHFGPRMVRPEALAEIKKGTHFGQNAARIERKRKQIARVLRLLGD